MGTSDLKLDLIQRVLLTDEVHVLRCLQAVLDREAGALDDFTDEEIAELNELQRMRKEGLETYLPLDEAMRMTREALKRRSE
ncbi:MAG: hypothetical protein IT226_14910 [Flavobacteriales bacterium]|nr:hypothetical protein [Flavobacteriales bacterium]